MIKNITGQRFGRLVVLNQTNERKNGSVVWICKCDCGSECKVNSFNLIRGSTKSCGCYRHEKLSMIAKTGNNRRTHGMKDQKIYRVWCSIKDRCCNPNCKGWKNYGGRGIKIFDGWKHDFISFYNYISKLPHYGEKGYSIDRIDNNGNYEPGNIRYATRKEQILNRRNTAYYEENGIKMTIKELARKTGIPYSTLIYRRRNGRTILKENEREKLWN